MDHIVNIGVFREDFVEFFLFGDVDVVEFGTFA